MNQTTKEFTKAKNETKPKQKIHKDKPQTKGVCKRNEIRRIINKLIEKYQPTIIVVEENLKNFIKEIINQYPKNSKEESVNKDRKEKK